MKKLLQKEVTFENRKRQFEENCRKIERAYQQRSKEKMYIDGLKRPVKLVFLLIFD